MGEAYLKAGRPADAVGVYEKMTDREPDHRLFSAVSVMPSWRQLISTGRSRLPRAAEIDPSEALAFYSRLAYAYLQAGQEQGQKEHSANA